MSDLIDRQAAINTVKKHYRVDNDLLEVIVYQLENLPSAYPETDGFCDGCKEYDQERNFCPRFDRVIRKTVKEMGIIHCKDCKHWSRESICDGFCSEDCMMHDEDFYCGYAERREDETD